jgi:hypothetical protein
VKAPAAGARAPLFLLFGDPEGSSFNPDARGLVSQKRIVFLIWLTVIVQSPGDGA